MFGGIWGLRGWFRGRGVLVVAVLVLVVLLGGLVPGGEEGEGMAGGLELGRQGG